MMAKERKELFISYGREPEVIQFVNRLKRDLENHGFSVWVDAHDIPAGSDWHGAIGTGLSRCRAIVPIITNKYIGSRYCVNELYTADGDKKHIFPIILEDVDFNSTEAGHGVKFVVSGVNWTMCRPDVDDYNNSISKLFQGMKEKGLGGSGEGDNDHDEVDHSRPHQAYPSVPAKPLVGPTSLKPFMIIPDVENPEGIVSTPDGKLVVSIMQQKVLIFNSDREKILELGGGKAGIGVGQFLSPNAVAVDAEGNILVAGHYFIQKFTSDGQFLQLAGGTDPKGFQLNTPRGMAIGKDGRIYIAEQQKHRVTILNPDLSFYKSFTDADRMLGSGHLNMPQGIAINNLGHVYVADMMNDAIQVFDADGQFLFRFGKMGSGPGCTTSPSAIVIDKDDYVYVGTSGFTVSIFDSKGEFVRAFGEYGSEVGKFNQIRALHIDCNGTLYVGEWSSNRIQIFRTGGSDGASLDYKEQAPQTTQVTPPPPPNVPQPPGLNITGEGKGMVIFGSKSVVSLGPNVVFRGHVVIQPGATVLTPGGPLPSPVAVPPGVSSGRQSQGGVVFAKSANAPCKRVGVNTPMHMIEGVKPRSIAVGRNGEIVMSTDKGKYTVFDEKYNEVITKELKHLSNSPLVINQENSIVVFRSVGITILDMELNETSKVTSKQNPALKEVGTVCAAAIGRDGRLYLVGSKKAHILDANFTYVKSFAEKCQAFAIAVSSEDQVYLPVMKTNTIHVFSAEGEPLFKFGDPGRSPVPQFSLLAPLSVAMDSHDRVYVGTGMSTVSVFDKEGRLVRVFGSKGSEPGEFERPTAMHIDQRDVLYVGDVGNKRIQVFQLED